jgi:PBSX family phage portal protein
MSAEQILSENQRVLKVIPIKAEGDERGISRKIPEDHFQDDYKSADAIEPPFDMFTLAVLPESSAILGPCIDAMEVNIEGLGHRVVPRDELDPTDEGLDPEIQAELAKVSNFFANATLEGTLVQLRRVLRRDLETTGNAYIEVLPSVPNPDEPAGLTHLPSWTMRLKRSDKEATSCMVPRAVKDEITGNWSIEDFPYRKHFRRFIQRRDTHSEKVYYKEWGDPRVIDYENGEVLAESMEKATPAQRQRAANPVIHIKLYSPRSPYGLPRIVGNFFTIYGNRAAEVINYTTLKCNNIPALLMMATNVQITSASITRIKEFVEERIQGDNNYSTILIVEAEPITEGLKDPGNMKIEVKPLTENQHTDAMFVKYMDRNDERIRQAFRMPPIFLGRSDEYNRATADASKGLAEEQVFGPERQNIDSIFNTTLVPALRAASVLFRSNTPNVTDNYELTQLLAVAERSGGLSPHISRLIVEDVLGRDLPDIDGSIDPNIPFTMTMLREQMMFETDESGNTTKRWSEDEVLDQLRMLKGMMSQSPGISTEARKAVDSLVNLMSIGGGSSIPKVKPKKRKAVKEVDVGSLKTIREVDGEYCVFSEDGETNFGCYETRGEAEDRLAQIETFSEKIFSRDRMVKVDGDQRIIGGAVLVPGVVDLQGDIYDEEAVTQAAFFWFENYLEDQENNGLKIMHKGEVRTDLFRPIQSFVLQEDTEFVLDLSAASEDHPAQEIESITYPKGTWMLYARTRDDSSDAEELWMDFKSGDLLGWSIGGVASVRELKALGLLKG